MDRIDSYWDEVLEEALKYEPLAELPPGFTASVMEKIQLEEVSHFNPFSLLDLILSLGAALTFGVLIGLPLLLPKQLHPWLLWFSQWSLYTLKQFVYSGTMIFVVALGIFVVIILVFSLGREVFREKRLVSELIHNHTNKVGSIKTN